MFKVTQKCSGGLDNFVNIKIWEGGSVEKECDVIYIYLTDQISFSWIPQDDTI